MQIFLQFIVGVYAVAQQIADKPPDSPCVLFKFAPFLRLGTETSHYRSEILRLVELASLTIHPDYLESYSRVLVSAYIACRNNHRRHIPAALP